MALRTEHRNKSGVLRVSSDTYVCGRCNKEYSKSEHLKRCECGGLIILKIKEKKNEI